ncbi:MAG: transcription-repair coupling factor [Oscillospiraceae bacterium]
MSTLSKILERDFDVVVAAIDAAVSPVISPEILKANHFALKTGDTLEVSELADRLLSAGYSRCDQIDGIGQFAIRGGIVDLFSPDNALPCRIDFWGDEIDTISFFDPVSQRRTDQVDKITLLPVMENACIDKSLLAERLDVLLKTEKGDIRRQRITADIDRLRSGTDIAFDAYLPQIFDGFYTLFDYLNDSIFLSESARSFERLHTLQKLGADDLVSLIEDGILPKKFAGFMLDFPALLSVLKSRNTVFLESFARSSYELPLSGLLTFNITQSAPFTGSAALLCEDLNPDKEHLSVVLAGSARAAENLAKELCENNIDAVFCPESQAVGARGVFVCTGSLSAGFELAGLKFTLITHSKSNVKSKKSKHKKGAVLNSLDELAIGDYVVHTAHGIGIFDGVNQLTTRGITQDYIKIRYSGKDVLYVPVTSLDMVSKYIGAKEDSGIKLNKLGSPQWANTRKRVRAAVKDMAKQLIVLYARRMSLKGFAFSADSDLQADFEHRFVFDETDDQLRCTEEIKQDMQQAVPMDRLLCGDVGFGKTEVALRAAFKCIADGKQCAILVPTTILAWQHYNTAIERFGNLPVGIEMLSRFRSAKQQLAIKKQLKDGSVDLIVGTHSIISGDVKFRDLGLMIIDEEQRFGVAQKEKLKELHPTVDCLTLSATPIPRTLNMALSGLRDMSSIEEAPQDRKPVQTYVLEYDKGIIIEAINKELRRGGQVYYLHNRTESIVSTAATLQKQLPDARIAVAHGKMDEEELSEVWQKLLQHELDVLVCTTIIETGVDVPNANTLIIEDADRFGLSQLHQLRGRVGRSHRRAFAYLFFRAGKALTDISQKRLDAIRQYTEFGAGFKIAMRDLEIRGAGSILGGEQHGHMEVVGYDMYFKMLSDAIAEEKGEKVSAESDCTIELRIGAHIPENYIESLPQRLSVYRRIADIRTDEDVLDVTDELLDRFGDPPDNVTDLMEVALLKAKAATHSIYDIVEQSGHVLLYVSKIDQEMTSRLMGEFKGQVMLNAGAKPYFSIRIPQNVRPLDALKRIMETADRAEV